jgi:hypothetical protein
MIIIVVLCFIMGLIAIEVVRRRRNMRVNEKKNVESVEFNSTEIIYENEKKVYKNHEEDDEKINLLNNKSF